MFGSTVTSGASVAVTSIHVVAGSRIVAPSSCQRRTVRALSSARGLGQLHAVVDARGRSRHPERSSAATVEARVAQQRHDVGQVLLALRVRGADEREVRAQRRRLEDVDARVDLGDGCLVRGRVLLLDDARDTAPSASRMTRP